MARVGNADYYHSLHGPRQRQGYWREVIARNYWEHPFHALNEQNNVVKPSYKGASSSSASAHGMPWTILNRTGEQGQDSHGLGYLRAGHATRPMGETKQLLKTVGSRSVGTLGRAEIDSRPAAGLPAVKVSNAGASLSTVSSEKMLTCEPLRSASFAHSLKDPLRAPSFSRIHNM